MTDTTNRPTPATDRAVPFPYAIRRRSDQRLFVRSAVLNGALLALADAMHTRGVYGRLELVDLRTGLVLWHEGRIDAAVGTCLPPDRLT